MKSKEQIINDSMKLELPEDYNLIEMKCFLALKQLVVMYYNKHISAENASKIKQQILVEYEREASEYEFQTSIYKEHIQHIRDTENARIKLHKILNSKEEITEERLCEVFNVCMEIIATVFDKEFNWRKV